MKLFTISDLHLPLGIDKPMDIFGRRWENYVERIRENWINTVTNEDVVVLGGDFSWATYLEESVKDFEFLEELPGEKILLKGNHDYWWTTASKLGKFTSENGFKSISFLHNNSYKFGTLGLCGTRGWSLDSLSSDEDKKIYTRELMRLVMSLNHAKNNGCDELIVFTHYPPVTAAFQETEFHKILLKYDVKKCIYGHLHGISHQTAFTGFAGDVEYILAAGDYTEFNLLKIAEI